MQSSPRGMFPASSQAIHYGLGSDRPVNSSLRRLVPSSSSSASPFPPLRSGPSTGFAFPGDRWRAHRPFSMRATLQEEEGQSYYADGACCYWRSGGESAVVAARHAAAAAATTGGGEGSAGGNAGAAALPNRCFRARIDVKQR
jgi:hypothetical protein